MKLLLKLTLILLCLFCTIRPEMDIIKNLQITVKTFALSGVIYALIPDAVYSLPPWAQWMGKLAVCYLAARAMDPIASAHIF